MEMEGIDEVFKRYRFNPSPKEAVTYFLPRLISGETMHGAERLIHRADVYGCEPRDLAARFAPVPQSLKSDDRFFFTVCKRQKGSSSRSSRVAGAGTWTIQKTTDINDARVKVGEVKKLSFKKGKGTSGWIMEEYRCCLQEAVVADGEKVLCKIYLSANAGAAARQESAAYLRQQEAEPAPPRPEPVSTHAPKRPAPVAADPPCPKRTRVAVSAPPVLAPPAASLPAAFTETEAPPAAAEADGDMDRFTCSLEELLGVCEAQEKEETENDDTDDQFASSLEGILGGEEEVDETLPPAAGDDKEEEEEAGQQQAVFATPIFNLADVPSFTLDDLDMLPAHHGEQPEQQQPVLTSDDDKFAMEGELMELLGRYKPRPMFRPDQLEGHSEFFSI